MDNDRKVALVTGAASGLGLEIARAIDDDYAVLPWDLAHGQDVTDAPNLSAEELPERLDVLINCAGINQIDWAPDVTP